MAQEDLSSPSATPIPSASRRVLALVNTAALALVLIVALGFLFLLSDLMGNTAALQAQARKSVKTVQAIRTELADIRDQLEAAEPPAVVASERSMVPQPVEPTATAVTTIPLAPQMSKAEFRTGAPLPICKFLPGNGSGLANCIKTKT